MTYVKKNDVCNLMQKKKVIDGHKEITKQFILLLNYLSETKTNDGESNLIHTVEAVI